jgi:F-type H+-transporting ATPase subunit b
VPKAPNPDLDEAKALREEAQTLLASYERKQREVQAQTDRIVANAKKRPSRVSRRKKTSVVNRSPFGRCGRPDRKRKASAIREVRNQAVKVAVAAAADVIATQTY